LRDLLEQKILSELCSGGDPAIFLRSHVLMERFYDGTDQENLKTQEGKNGGKKKKRFFFNFNVLGDSHTRVFSISQSRTPLGYRPCATLPQENPLVWEPPLQQCHCG